jgi:hypothetical protein
VKVFRIAKPELLGKITRVFASGALEIVWDDDTYETVDPSRTELGSGPETRARATSHKKY